MGAEDEEARFAINLDSDVDEVSAEASSEIEQLRQRILSSTDAVKRLSAAHRSLRGATDEVKQAKDELKAKLDAERAAISAGNLALLKQGVTYEKVADNARKLEAEKKRLDDQLKSKAAEQAKAQADKMGNAVKLAGGPVSELSGLAGRLQGVLGGAGGAMGAVALAATAAVAIVTALVVGVLALAAAFVRFVLVSGDAARSMNLVREAATGSAENARNLGAQVDELAGKVPTAKEKLNELAAQLARTRLSGRAIVDTFNAVGQASAAMGDEVGKQLQDIITRGQIAQRIQVNPLELQKSGVRFDDIAGALAKQLHIGVDKAKAALFEGRVKLDDGAKAIRAAVEKRFADINIRKSLSLDTQLLKLKERLTSLAADVHIEPVLKAVDKFFSLFDESTVAGSALKTLVTTIGNELGPAFEVAGELAKGFLEGTILAALELGIAFFKVKKFVKDTFGADAVSNLVSAEDAVNVAKFAVYGLVGAVALLAGGIALVTAPIWLGALALLGLYEAGKTAWDWFSGLDWSAIGTSIVDGLVNGVKGAASKLTDAVKGLAGGVRSAFAAALGIHSPSRVMFELGTRLPEGAAGGVRARSGLVTHAVEGMAADAETAGETGPSSYQTASTTRAPAPPASSGSGSGLAIDVGGIVIKVEGGGANAAEQLSSPSFLAQLTKTLRDALLAAGVPTQGATT